MFPRRTRGQARRLHEEIPAQKKEAFRRGREGFFLFRGQVGAKAQNVRGTCDDSPGCFGRPPAQSHVPAGEDRVLTSWTWSCSSWSSTSWRRPSSSRRTCRMPSLPWRLPPFLSDKSTERENYRQSFFLTVQTIFILVRAHTLPRPRIADGRPSTS